MTDEPKIANVHSLEYQKNRFMEILDRSIILTREDPLERLEQFCEQGLYSYEFHHDEFQNGVMCSLKLKKGGQTIAKEARFVKTFAVVGDEGESLLTRAEKTVAAVLLDNLDLGVVGVEPEKEAEPDEETDDTETRFQEMASKGMNVVFEALNKMISGDMMKDFTDE